MTIARMSGFYQSEGNLALYAPLCALGALSQSPSELRTLDADVDFKLHDTIEVRNLSVSDRNWKYGKYAS